MVSSLTLKFLIHFVLILRVRVPILFFYIRISSFPTPFIEDRLSAIEYSWVPGQVLLDHMCLGLFVGLSILFFWPIFLFLYQ